MSGMKRFRDYHIDQPMLLPPDLREWLPSDHMVHFVIDIVDEFDLSAFYADYTERRGQPPYDPEMMVRVWLYGFMRGIRSSRKLEQALREDVGFRFLSANQQPKYWALSEFRRRHHGALGGLFGQTVMLCLLGGLIDLKHVAIDGTKIKANASRNKAMSYQRLVKEEQRIQEQIEQWFRECDATDRSEDAEYGDRCADQLPEDLADRKKRLEAIRKAKADLEAEARAKAQHEQDERRAEAEAQGRSFKPRKDPSEAVPDPKAQRNFTDPDARIMRTSKKNYEYCYNGQAAVDSKYQIIVAADLTNQANDTPHLPEMVEQTETNTGERPEQLSADAGYYSDANLEYLEGDGASDPIEAFIPPDKVKHSEWREAKPPRGRLPKNPSRKYLMRRKLRTKRGREVYVLRQTTVEPVFGQLKIIQGLREFLLRGLAKTRSEYLFACATHNLLKMFRLGYRPQRSATAH